MNIQLQAPGDLKIQLWNILNLEYLQYLIEGIEYSIESIEAL